MLSLHREAYFSGGTPPRELARLRAAFFCRKILPDLPTEVELRTAFL